MIGVFYFLDVDRIRNIRYVRRSNYLAFLSEPTASPVLQKGHSDVLDVGTPFYQDGQLQVRVYWKKRGRRKAMDHVFSQPWYTAGKPLHCFFFKRLLPQSIDSPLCKQAAYHKVKDQD